MISQTNKRVIFGQDKFSSLLLEKLRTTKSQKVIYCSEINSKKQM
jgi:hypothetical protein